MAAAPRMKQKLLNASFVFSCCSRGDGSNLRPTKPEIAEAAREAMEGDLDLRIFAAATRSEKSVKTVAKDSAAAVVRTTGVWAAMPAYSWIPAAKVESVAPSALWKGTGSQAGIAGWTRSVCSSSTASRGSAST